MTQGVKPSGNDGPGDWDCSMRISGSFIDPLKKPNSQTLWHAPLSSWSHFEHSNTKMGSLQYEPLYWTLCLSIISMCFTLKFHLNMSKYNIWGETMPEANLYTKDCKLKVELNWILAVKSWIWQIPCFFVQFVAKAWQLEFWGKRHSELNSVATAQLYSQQILVSKFGGRNIVNLVITLVLFSFYSSGVWLLRTPDICRDNQ